MIDIIINIKSICQERLDWKLTCFSKALGTSRLNSDRLLLIRSRLRFSIICQWATRNNGIEVTGGGNTMGSIKEQWHLALGIMSLLTPLRLFLACTWVVVMVGDMEPWESSWLEGKNSMDSLFFIYIYIFFTTKLLLEAQIWRVAVELNKLVRTSCDGKD